MHRCGKIQKFDVVVAKNYLTESELAQLPAGQRLSGCCREHGTAQDSHDHAGLGDAAEPLHRSHRPEMLQDAGRVTAEIAKAHAESEFEKYRIVQDRLFESDFDRAVKQLEQDEKKNQGDGQ
jgi:hypothetical protein